MSKQPSVDQAKVEAFVGKVLLDTSATMVTMLVVIGDRLGLFKDLAAHGPTTSVELADRAGIHERYAREWQYRCCYRQNVRRKSARFSGIWRGNGGGSIQKVQSSCCFTPRSLVEGLSSS